MLAYQLVERPLTVDEYLLLRYAVGWGNADRIATQISIDNSLYWVCLCDHERVIGCGRVVGDGGLYFYIQDIIVLPAYQRQGLGNRMMVNIMQYIHAHLRPGGFVGLMAAKGASAFYIRYGFAERPTDDYGPGMHLYQV